MIIAKLLFSLKKYARYPLALPLVLCSDLDAFFQASIVTNSSYRAKTFTDSPSLCNALRPREKFCTLCRFHSLNLVAWSCNAFCCLFTWLNEMTAVRGYIHIIINNLSSYIYPCLSLLYIGLFTWLNWDVYYGSVLCLFLLSCEFSISISFSQLFAVSHLAMFTWIWMNNIKMTGTVNIRKGIIEMWFQPPRKKNGDESEGERNLENHTIKTKRRTK